MEEILDNQDAADNIKAAFQVLSELMGGVEILDQAMEIAPNISAKLAVSYLQQLYKLLTLYGVEDHITFDLSMSGSYGIIPELFSVHIHTVPAMPL